MNGSFACKQIVRLYFLYYHNYCVIHDDVPYKMFITAMHVQFAVCMLNSDILEVHFASVFQYLYMHITAKMLIIVNNNNQTFHLLEHSKLLVVIF